MKKGQLRRRKPFFVPNTYIISNFSSIRGPPSSFLLTLQKIKRGGNIVNKNFLKKLFLKDQGFGGLRCIIVL